MGGLKPNFMVAMGVFPFQGKTYMVEPGIEPGTSWLVVRNSDHQSTRLVTSDECIIMKLYVYRLTDCIYVVCAMVHNP